MGLRAGPFESFEEEEAEEGDVVREENGTRTVYLEELGQKASVAGRLRTRALLIQSMEPSEGRDIGTEAGRDIFGRDRSVLLEEPTPESELEKEISEFDEEGVEEMRT